MFVSGTARNIALVYIDMRGIGRKALIKKVGKAFVSGQVKSLKKEDKQPV
jgi:spartin